MFSAQFMLAKKGPLAKIWLAAHWDKKITKAAVYDTNIESCVKGVLEPKVKMALRTTGHLLLGIVRIYSRKAKYLLGDCNEAYIKLKMAFRPEAIDLPEAKIDDAATVTLPEIFYEFDTDVADLKIDMDAQMILNQSRVEDITLKEDYNSLNLFHEYDFEDMEFEREVARGGKETKEATENINFSLLYGPSKEKLEESAQGINNASIVSKASVSLDTPVKDDGFGGVVGEGFLVGLFEDAPFELFEKDLENSAIKNSENLGTENQPEQHHENTHGVRPSCSRTSSSPIPSPLAKVPRLNTDTNVSDFDAQFSPDSVSNDFECEVPNFSPEPAASELTVSSELIPSLPDLKDKNLKENEVESFVLEPLDEIIMQRPSLPDLNDKNSKKNEAENFVLETDEIIMQRPSLPDLNDKNSKKNEAESFVLEPLDEIIMQDAEKIRKVKRRRKLIIDQVKNISAEEMRLQINTTVDNATTIDLAPPTKRLMLWKEAGSVENLLSRPGHPLPSKKLSELYRRHLTIRVHENENVRTTRTKIKAGSVGEKRKATGLPAASKASFPNDSALSLSSAEIPSNLQPQHPVFSPALSPEKFDEPQKQLSPDAFTLEVIQQVAQLSITEPVCKELLCDNTFRSSEHYQSSVTQLPGHSNTQQNQVLSQTTDDVSWKKIDLCTYSDGQQVALGNADEYTLQLPVVSIRQERKCLTEQLTQPHVEVHENVLSSSVRQVSSMVSVRQEGKGLTEQRTQPHVEVHENVLSSSVLAVLPCSDHSSTTCSNERNNTYDEPNRLPNKDINLEIDPQAKSNTMFDYLNREETQFGEHEAAMLQEESSESSLFDYCGGNDTSSSAESVSAEEQAADETYEQFEERKAVKRTVSMLHLLHSRMRSYQNISFADLIKNNKRKEVAQKFFTLLLLKKQQAVELEQAPYSSNTIFITKGPKFDTGNNGN